MYSNIIAKPKHLEVQDESHQASKPLESQEIFRNAEKDIGTEMKTRSLVLFCTGLTTGFSAWCKCLRMRPRLLEVVGKAYSVTFREVGEQQRNE